MEEMSVQSYRLANGSVRSTQQKMVLAPHWCKFEFCPGPTKINWPHRIYSKLLVSNKIKYYGVTD